MSLRHAILTALLERPSSGLDLTRRFDRSFRYFWQATHQQVYREIGKLEGENLLKSVPQPPSRGSRKMFEVSASGRSELIRWIAQAEALRPVRDPMLIRLRAASVVGLGPLVETMRSHRDEHAQQHAQYLAIEERDFSNRDLGDAAKMQYLVLQFGIRYEELWTGWLSEAIAVLSDMPRTNPKGS